MLGQENDTQKKESKQGLPEDQSKFSDRNPPKPEDDESSDAQARRAHIRKWLKKITDAKEKWKDDFDRMRDNMDFVAGIQWSGQKKIQHSQYIVNMTLRTINQRVATLYARNPRVTAKRRARLDFQLWDGNSESILEAVMQSAQLAQSGIPLPPQILALFADYQAGRQRQQLISRVGETLEKVYHYQQDQQDPAYKTQMKQLVRRISVCGVGYLKTQFCRDYETELTQSETRLNVVDRARRAQRIIQRMQDGKVQPEDSEMQEVKMLLASLQEQPNDYESVAVKEHLIFDFPKATSIIPDENCSILRGFIGAQWIAEEFRWDVEFVNAYFEKDIKPDVDVKMYGPDAKPVDSAMTHSQEKVATKNKMTLWQVWDLNNKSTFVVADGYKEYIQNPEVVTPVVKGFWQHVPITFNDVEVEEGCKATIFPPSDVDLIRHPQEQINRTRNSESRHRVANRPRAMVAKGMLSKDDLDTIANADDNQIVELEKVPPGIEPGKVLQPLLMTPFQEQLYDTQKYQEDAQLAGGVAEANVGLAQPHVTATVGSIQEQSRVTVSSSDVDALDDGLTDAAKIGQQMLMTEMSKETVVQIAGPGAAWADDPNTRKDFLNEIDLEVVAASSGRPNKAVEIANLDKVIPLVLQAVQLPPQAQPTIQSIIKLVLKTLDSDLEATDFFPIPMPMMPPQQGEADSNAQQQQGQSGQPTRGGNGNGGPPHPSARNSKRNKQPARPAQTQVN